MLGGLMVYEQFRFATWPGSFLLYFCTLKLPPSAQVCIKYTLANLTLILTLHPIQGE